MSGNLKSDYKTGNTWQFCVLDDERCVAVEKHCYPLLTLLKSSGENKHYCVQATQVSSFLKRQCAVT